MLLIDLSITALLAAIVLCLFAWVGSISLSRIDRLRLSLRFVFTESSYYGRSQTWASWNDILIDILLF